MDRVEFGVASSWTMIDWEIDEELSMSRSLVVLNVLRWAMRGRGEMQSSFPHLDAFVPKPRQLSPGSGRMEREEGQDPTNNLNDFQK